MASRHAWTLSAAAGIVAAVACGGSSSSGGRGDGGLGGDAEWDTGYSGTGTGTGTGTGDDSGLNLGDTGTSSGFAGCAATSQKATQSPLDVYLMLDSSGSMDDLVAAGQSKWSSVVTAMTGFVNDPASAGIGVGLQYFPLPAAGVPASCTTNAQCGASGPCLLAVCSKLKVVALCATDADCPGGSQCVAVGHCHNDPNYLCQGPGTSDCLPDPNGFPLGACDTMTTSSCAFGDSCAPQDYATPAVTVAPLPGAAASITASLAAHSPQGSTPTAAALAGAVSEASTYARAHPGHSVVAVLATDGIPDECTPSTIAGIAQIAASAFAGTPKIKTFAIGVFAPGDVASGTSALDAIASAGGTGSAFIVNSSTQNVEAQFSAALATIRGASLPCSYQVPHPDGGTPDFGKLNVQYTAGSGAVSTIGYVESPGRCSATTGGWYYDADPAEGGVPTEIVVCPSTCTTLSGDAKGRVDVLLGCQTVIK